MQQTLHDSINPGTLLVKHATEMLWLTQYVSLLGGWDRRSIFIKGCSFSCIPSSVVSNWVFLVDEIVRDYIDVFVRKLLHFTGIHKFITSFIAQPLLKDKRESKFCMLIWLVLVILGVNIKWGVVFAWTVSVLVLVLLTFWIHIFFVHQEIFWSSL
jgi:hypothetical protein